MLQHANAEAPPCLPYIMNKVSLWQRNCPEVDALRFANVLIKQRRRIRSLVPRKRAREVNLHSTMRRSRGILVQSCGNPIHSMTLPTTTKNWTEPAQWPYPPHGWFKPFGMPDGARLSDNSSRATRCGTWHYKLLRRRVAACSHAEAQGNSPMPDGAGMAPSNNEPRNELSDRLDGAGMAPSTGAWHTASASRSRMLLGRTGKMPRATGEPGGSRAAPTARRTEHPMSPRCTTTALPLAARQISRRRGAAWRGDA